jgi:cyclic pyranopterin phosphate synthase
MSDGLTHFDPSGASRMVDTSDKPITLRTAEASARVEMRSETLQMIRDRRAVKGDVFEVARLAGIMAAKRTGDLIPLCHPLGLTSVSIEFEIQEPSAVLIRATTRVHARTGVEMEALTAASLAALTIYDMCKAVDRSMVIGEVRLLRKTGGIHGDWILDNRPGD